VYVFRHLPFDLWLILVCYSLTNGYTSPPEYEPAITYFMLAISEPTSQASFQCLISANITRPIIQVSLQLEAVQVLILFSSIQMAPWIQTQRPIVREYFTASPMFISSTVQASEAGINAFATQHPTWNDRNKSWADVFVGLCPLCGTLMLVYFLSFYTLFVQRKMPANKWPKPCLHLELQILSTVLISTSNWLDTRPIYGANRSISRCFLYA